MVCAASTTPTMHCSCLLAEYAADAGAPATLGESRGHQDHSQMAKSAYSVPINYLMWPHPSHRHAFIATLSMQITLELAQLMTQY